MRSEIYKLLYDAKDRRQKEIDIVCIIVDKLAEKQCEEIIKEVK